MLFLKEVTEVWHIAHFWMSHGRCAMDGLPMGCSERTILLISKSSYEANGGQQGTPHSACL